ncbi:MAG TPA: hypothetical protein VFH33_00045 [Candidatus Krumholzibacteria bacterium]|nr:hypothetical protein [Candidatus Krumholzibacteria bacterium]
MGSSILALFVFYCYWPLTHFFFSQDDFYFLQRATSGFRASMEQSFTMRPGHFRPLTKGLYFLAAWPLFELNAFPYHVVSLALHAVNSILAGVVLRRFGVSVWMSWIAALLFAANVANLEAVAWISCVQQLLSTTFALAALIWGVDAIATRSRSSVIAASIAYLLALGSYEQTLAVPLVLILWTWSRHGARRALRTCGGALLPMLLLMLVYLGFVLGLRGLPHEGPYVMWVGRNVVENFREYTGSMFAIWLSYPYLDLPLGLRGSHIVWLALVAWYLILRRPRELVFGCATFVLFLAPVLFIHYHVFSFHLYLPAIGAWYLIATAGDALVRVVPTLWRRSVAVTAVCAVVLAAAGSTVAVRKNTTNYVSADVKLPKIRVLRRAVLAEQVCNDVSERWPRGPRLSLVYAGRSELGNWGNIKCAIHDGDALRLVLHQPALPVDFLLPSQVSHVPTDQIMVVTELGEALTVDQYRVLARYRPLTWRFVETKPAQP